MSLDRPSLSPQPPSSGLEASAPPRGRLKLQVCIWQLCPTTSRAHSPDVTRTFPLLSRVNALRCWVATEGDGPSKLSQALQSPRA